MKNISKQVKLKIAIAGILAASAVAGYARAKYETIDAQAFGTSTQMGKNARISLIIYQYSTPDDQKILIESFKKGQNDGLANALEKKKAVGRISITGTLGFDDSYIHETKTPTGRKVTGTRNRSPSI